MRRAAAPRASPVLFFPEGTRSRDGELGDFKIGAFDLAVEHGVPLIPVAVHGTGRALPKHGMILREHVDAHVEVLPPMEPGDSADALREKARRRIAAALME